MKIAVTGASGFIGRHVVAELLRKNIEVVAVTRNNGLSIKADQNIRLVTLDIAHQVKECFTLLGRPDVLLHLAWDGLPNYTSLHHFESELPRQYHFLKQLIDAGLPNLLVTGTCFEYGLLSGPLAEDTRPQPNNPYGFAKEALHQQLEFLKTANPFNLIWGRLFYMYGEGQPGRSLFSQLRDAVLRGEKTFNMSGGEQLRDYLPVTMVAKKLVQLALSGQDMGTINICSGIPVSVRSLVEQWIKQYSWDIELNLGFYQYPDHEPMAYWGKTSSPIH